MKANSFKLAELIIPLTLLAFVGPGIKYINVVFNSTTRWGMLLVLTVFLLAYRRRNLLGLLRRPIFWAVMTYGLWGVATVAWSEVPEISQAKSLAFLWVAVAMMGAGYAWVMRHPATETMDFLWLLALASLFSSLMGQSEQNLDTGSFVYSGLTGNPNYLGFILTISGAWLIWRAYQARLHDRLATRIYLGLLAINCYYLFLSHSRASLLTFTLVVFGVLLGMGKIRKWLPHAFLVVALSAGGYTFSTTVQEFVQQYVLKSDLEYLDNVGGNLWFSREQVWQESFELAMRGGTLGGGYGVTIGESFSGQIGPEISAGQYGREQGNTQLAILEQTGLIGFGLYLALVLSIVISLTHSLHRAQAGSDKVAIGLLGGTITGLLVMSIFEAWWVAPGAPESATFWLLVGALLAACKRARKASGNPRRKPAPGQPIEPPLSAESQAS
jgi:hypothetical protein